MKLITSKVKGMQDILPGESEKWLAVEEKFRKIAQTYGFKFIRTPILEHTELFEHSAGETSDIVEKEMYTFNDKAKRSLTLRPEGTAGVLRAVLENGLFNNTLPLKLMYISPCYRYESPQSGRFREFFQFGAEIFGSNSVFADIELISTAKALFERFGINNLRLELNSIGCKNCRAKYKTAIFEYFKNCKNLCNICQTRLKLNPMRILDCKNKICNENSNFSPIILDFLCKECLEHFDKLKQYLTKLQVKFTVNPKIVRGLDYYTKTVFEFILEESGSELTVCAGGRYDLLSEKFGGPPLPAIGFGIGIERFLLLAEKFKLFSKKPQNIEVYIAPISNFAIIKAFNLAEILRKNSIITEIDIKERNLASQLKYANKISAKYLLVLGDDEINNNTAKLKEMSSGREFKISLNDDFYDNFINLKNSAKI
jgi:histidyl-tRNA synthetase